MVHMDQIVLEEPDEVCLGESGWVRYADNRQGLSLCQYFWPAAKPKGVILAVHGHGSHMQFEFLALQDGGKPFTYKGSWVEKFNAMGFSVCGVDSQSHGRSQGANGLRCYVNEFQDFVNDVIDLGRWLKESTDVAGFSGLDVFILGKSLGGCIATNAIHQKGELFVGAVLLAPMLSLEKISKEGLNPYLRPLASLLSWLTPTLPVAQTAKNLMFPDIQDAYDNDVGCWHNNTRARVASEYLRATEETCKAMAEMNFPFLVVHSVQDEMTDVDGSKMLYEKSKATDKTLELVSNMWHFLIKEPGNEKILEMSLKWMSERV